MALPAVLESLDDLPEAIREHYEEQSGKYRLVVTPVDGLVLENPEPLRKALNEERKRAREAESSLKVYEGLDPSAARTAIEELTKIKAKGPPDVKAQIQAAIQEEQRRHTEEAKKLSEERDSAKELLKKHIKRADMARAMSSKESRVLSQELLEPHVDRFVQVLANDDGDLRTVVVDEEGNPRHAFNEKGVMVDFSIESLLSEMRLTPKYAPLFQSETSGGSGAKPSNGTRTPLQSDRDLSPRQRIEAQYAKTTTRR